MQWYTEKRFFVLIFLEKSTKFCRHFGRFFLVWASHRIAIGKSLKLYQVAYTAVECMRRARAADGNREKRPIFCCMKSDHIAAS